ncbi:hypothetical protein [Pseudomonas fluorescens]|uniref:Glutathionylspermidine synthase pre-ATP-grasp-like domain-containing protein n=1 Tax=Pseudomonas fluorescens TaxID=294 RepID=A0A423LW72_PSEFL|nr:hypothetical protein [Pseudomonas fluorescens]RON72532.1 hypothetical protein BK671_01370 [Pseudomonas fluorescens]
MRLWNGNLFEKGKVLGVYESHDRLLAGIKEPPTVDFREIHESAHALQSVIFRIYRDYYKADIKAMALDLGFRPDVADLVSLFSEQITPDSFARVDLFVETQGWKFLEFNMGSLIGGMQYASLPRLSGFQQTGDVLKSWARGMKAHDIHENSLTLFLVDESIVEDIRHPLSVFSQAVQDETGSEVVIASPRSIVWDGLRLTYQSRVVDNIYCRFEQEQLLERPDDYRDFLSALKAKAVNCPQGLGYNVLAGKGVWALLWQFYLENNLDDADRALVKEHLPLTHWLVEETQDIALKEQSRWVLKPTDGYAGRDVVCGREVTAEDWAEKIRKALGIGGKAYILQEYIEPEPLLVATIDENGRLEEYKARVVWGFYFLEGQYQGGLLRALPLSQTAVINYATGAATGPMMKVEQSRSVHE